MTDTNNYELDPDPETAAQHIKPKLAEISDSMCMAKWLWTSIHLTNGTTNSCYLPPTHKINAEDVKNNHKVLEIGTGSGYQCAILSKLARRIYTIERIKKLYEKSCKIFEELQLTNICLLYTSPSQRDS